MAKIKAIGEAIERFFIANYNVRDLTSSSYAKLKKTHSHVVNPSLFFAFSEKQVRNFLGKGISLRNENALLRWVRGIDLCTGKKYCYQFS